MKDQQGKTQSRVTDEKSTRPGAISRRALLRSGVTAMPAILTLQSGAAFARTSNLVSAAPLEAKVDGQTYCLDLKRSWAEPVEGSGNIYDLGANPSVTVNVITEHNHLTAQGSGDPISEGAMCERGNPPGEPYYYNDKDGTGWHTVDLPNKGIVLSSGAWTSIAEHSIKEFM